MAEMNIFRYFPQDSPVHRLHTRCKFVILFCFSFACLNTNTIGLSILSFLLIIVFLLAKLPFRTLLKDLKYFLFFIPIIIIVPALKATNGGVDDATVSLWNNEGLWYGIHYAWKLLLFLALGTILIGATTISSITNTIEWLLTPIPFIPETKVALMISLTVTFIPLIADQTQEILNAQKARGVGKQRNPITRIRYIVYPLVVKTLSRIDEIAFAMEARCYNEQRTKRKTTIRQSDWWILALAVLICVLVFYFFRA
ncbi:MAG: energy-coupling factor transporter transmembrane protein EcfT [Saprospiraceae bacterium]